MQSSGIVIALIAQILLAVSLIVDKILLKPRAQGNVVVYVFWLGILNAFGIFLFPFGFTFPSLVTILIALAAGIIFLFALAAYYIAIRESEASYALTVIGGFTPLAALAFAIFLLPESLNAAQYAAFVIIIAGSFAMILSERVFIRKTILWIFLASLLFGISSVFAKIVFNGANFISGFVFLKAGTFLAGLAMLAVPNWRRLIFAKKEHAPIKNMYVYFANRALAGIGALLILFAISLEHPAIIEAVTGVRYAIVFIAAFFITKLKPLWLKEKFTTPIFLGKSIATLLIIIGVAILGMQDYYENQPIPSVDEITWGVTFSTLAAERFGLDWKEAYLTTLYDLRPDGVRIAAYWPDIESKNNEFDFSKLDFQMDAAAHAGVPVILAIGQKVPRWPECHVPRWARDYESRIMSYESELLEYLEAMVGRYKNHPALQYWQVENEPFLAFGECDHKQVRELVDEEVVLVKSIDDKHPILTTDGGEFGDWYRAAKLGDIFGTTLYRRVFQNTFGYITYPLSPEWYQLRKDITQFLLRTTSDIRNKKFIVIELGAEPWDKKENYEISYGRQIELFSIDNFKEDIEYTRRARFDTYYLWGAEWWYSLKTQYEDDRYWEYAKKIISSKN